VLLFFVLHLSVTEIEMEVVCFKPNYLCLYLLCHYLDSTCRVLARGDFHVERYSGRNLWYSKFREQCPV